jgi:hypothetical protein
MRRTNSFEDVDPNDERSVMRALAGERFGAVTRSAATLQNVGRVSDLDSLLAGIEHVLPRCAVMFIEGTSITPDSRKILAERSIEPERDDLWGTVWPRSEGFDLPVTDDNLHGLRELAGSRPACEICDHVTVYSGDRILLVAHDVGSEVLVNRELPAEAVRRFREFARASQPSSPSRAASDPAGGWLGAARDPAGG